MERKTIAVLNHYNFLAVSHGGSQAIQGFYRALSRWCDIRILANSSGYPGSYFYRDCVALNPYINVHLICKTKSLSEMERQFVAKNGMSNPRDIVADYSLLSRQKEHIEQVSELIRDCEIVVSDHPYMYRLIKASCPNKTIWYRAHNVEYDYVTSQWRNQLKSRDSDMLAEKLSALEKECCEGCSRIFTLTQNDADRLCDLYGIYANKIMNISAGFDTTQSGLLLPSERSRKQNLPRDTQALYIASEQYAAIKAATAIIRNAPLIPEIQFIIAGSVCRSLSLDAMPENVKLLGVITNEHKDSLLRSSNLALNLVEGGSGINIKMLEYFAYGLPVITTRFGSRGINVTDGVDCIITETDNFVEDIKRFLALSITEKDNMAKNAYRLLERDHGWRNSAYKFACEIYGGDIPDEAEDINFYKYPNNDHFTFPEKPIYIRGAGKYGLKCLDYMRCHNVTPVGFIDIDETKAGTSIEGIPVFGDSEFNLRNGEAAVVAASEVYHEIVPSLIKSGMTPDNIIIGYNGNHLFRLDGSDGNYPSYLDFNKFFDSIT